MNDMAYPSGTERVKAWLEGVVLHVRFNNPEKHNALSVVTGEAVPELLDKAAKDDNVRMVVLSGEGGKSFVSGADISQFEDLRAAKEAVRRYESLAGRRCRASTSSISRRSPPPAATASAAA
jgi:enoyl-CoA hydratase/carnithine racemase